MKLSNFQLAYILLSIPSHMQVDGDQCVFFVHSDCPISTTSKTPFREVKGEVHIMNIQPRLTSRTLGSPDKVQSFIPYSSMDDQQTLSKILSVFYNSK